LHIAISVNGCNTADLVQLLLDFGADSVTKDNNGKLPLDVAVMKKCKVEVIKPLLTEAVTTSMTMDDKIDLCYVACKLMCRDVTQYLMSKWGVSADDKTKIQDALVQKAKLAAEAAAANKKKQPKATSNKKRSSQEASMNPPDCSSSSTVLKRSRQAEHHQTVFGAINSSPVLVSLNALPSENEDIEDDSDNTSNESDDDDAQSLCSETTLECDQDSVSLASQDIFVTSDVAPVHSEAASSEVPIEQETCVDHAIEVMGHFQSESMCDIESECDVTEDGVKPMKDPLSYFRMVVDENGREFYEELIEEAEPVMIILSEPTSQSNVSNIVYDDETLFEMNLVW
jgi:hypothetical protein